MKTPLTPSLADAMIDDREFIDAGSKSFRQLQAHSLQHRTLHQSPVKIAGSHELRFFGDPDTQYQRERVVS
jgi:hypothetical protein